MYAVKLECECTWLWLSRLDSQFRYQFRSRLGSKPCFVRDNNRPQRCKKHGQNAWKTSEKTRVLQAWRSFAGSE